MAIAWRHISRSVQGESHLADGTPCQDSSRVRTFDGRATGTLVACVSDGAGSAKHSATGSLAVCNAVVESVDAFLAGDGKITALETKNALDWVDLARSRIEEEADARDARATDFAATISVAILSPEGSCFFQIGDGAIVLRSGDVSGVVFWPESGEYANTTTFITSKEYRDRLRFYVTERAYKQVALFTDGIERIALRFDSLTPHPPFFDPLFQALATLENWQSLGDNLEQFLKSESVGKRSDDDKTLILATRIDA
jgi:serine/threonine protein phosphatase PrpC